MSPAKLYADTIDTKNKKLFIDKLNKNCPTSKKKNPERLGTRDGINSS